MKYFEESKSNVNTIEIHWNTFTYTQHEHKINSPIVAEITSVLSREHSMVKKEEEEEKQMQSIFYMKRDF